MTGTPPQINAAFIPLTDCAPLIVAHEMGFAKQEGLELNLVKETSWATVRDRLAVAHTDVAHALAPMPLASTLGLGPLPQGLIAPMALGFGGNTVTVSSQLWADLKNHGCSTDFDAGSALLSLSRFLTNREVKYSKKLRFGVVHPHSVHRYELAYWLASGGIMPERDVEFVVLPPSLMAEALGNGDIDGFCAGEPWGSIASAEGAGTILTSKAHIWRSSPEKVIAVRESWAHDNREQLNGLLRALYHSCCWCDKPDNHEKLAGILSLTQYLNQPQKVILPGLKRTLVSGDGTPRYVDGLFNFCERAATFPWRSHALWLYTQMVRWGEIPHTPDQEKLARSTYRPDIYRSALAPLNIPIPSANEKVEGALTSEISVGSTKGTLFLGPDGFFDGRVFDPDMIEDYISEITTQDRTNLES